jgi:hypothetical protein
VKNCDGEIEVLPLTYEDICEEKGLAAEKHWQNHFNDMVESATYRVIEKSSEIWIPTWNGGRKKVVAFFSHSKRKRNPKDHPLMFKHQNYTGGPETTYTDEEHIVHWHGILVLLNILYLLVHLFYL